ncbi:MULTISPECIES: M56 family metallopeptidase [unclassified Janthinobacterium]|uniref:M56 family metallopeptidase n=1 Tax=unclassified Janthinobacterium TaxID=2610881 RepID=UPI001E3F16D9|nr:MULTISPECIES: M56 family metallopeptidase [unclassified Janthinobacterium]MCC7644129.1 serine hydrolase [Janthinobacterium sp. EB271-G4-3-1]MCC7692222.1 serine hydrolase [Janthinobacterium sp. EB271-G4-3-2]
MSLDTSLGIELGKLVPALGWVLLYFVWQGVIVGAVSAVLLWLLRHASARWRYAVCALALLLCLCIPIVHLLSLLSGISPAQLPVDAPPAWRAALQAWMPALVLAWSAGVGLMSLRLCLGLAWVGKLRRQAVAAPAIWQARLDALAQRMGLHRRPPLKLHAGLASPVTVGFWHPVILLPAALLSGMPVALLEALLAHELAHVRRWDYLVNLLQSVAEALLFFHPVVWWLSARMRAEREQVADALAAQALQDPQQLATALHALSLQTAAPNHSGLLMSARGGALLTRIERLMAPGLDTGSWKMAVPALLLACATLLLQTQGKPAVSGATLAEAAAGMLDLPVSAKHMLVFDDASGKVLMAKDADAVVPIASITKLMTAMVVLDAGQDRDEQVRIVRADGDASLQRHSLLADGVAVSRGALLQLALLPSENRAAAALARTYPGGSAAFNDALQAKIRSLGLSRTTLLDPVGSSPANTSTASEVAKIVAAAARYPDIARITSHPQASVAVNGKTRTLHNTNPLVGGKGWDIVLSKTGSSSEAGSCLSMRMRSGGKHVTVVLLDADGAQRRSLDAGHIRDTLADRTGRMH